ncbi:FixH family protein [Peribacillus glennii]|uniref:YtkA-like domain-containing protein n=1 Tax=Peribacillus glennii TaxID=2303991 RepID=A0A372LH76_9BACI|nr:FixH family protein [Peribacillus glennii]RFU65419.1 hypothetical protein D0466_05875 [Peribacillus glennii]
MKKLSIAALAIMALLGGCTNAHERDETPKMLNVDFNVNPETAKPGDKVHFEAKVTYGAEQVEDADEVTFEIWRSQSKKHQKIKANNAKNGTYDLEKTFSKEGTYYVYAHVTARSMHTMPKKEFVIGKPSAPEKEGSSHHMEKDTMENEENEPLHSH